MVTSYTYEEFGAVATLGSQSSEELQSASLVNPGAAGTALTPAGATVCVADDLAAATSGRDRALDATLTLAAVAMIIPAATPKTTTLRTISAPLMAFANDHQGCERRYA